MVVLNQYLRLFTLPRSLSNLSEHAQFPRGLSSIPGLDQLSTRNMSTNLARGIGPGNANINLHSMVRLNSGHLMPMLGFGVSLMLLRSAYLIGPFFSHHQWMPRRESAFNHIAKEAAVDCTRTLTIRNRCTKREPERHPIAPSRS